MENKNEKRVLRVELDDEVKKVSITGKDSDEKVVMKQELDEDELDIVTGGAGSRFNEVADNHYVIGEGSGCEFDCRPVGNLITGGSTWTPCIWH